MNVALLLEMAAEAAPDRIALGDPRGPMTYRWLHDRASRVAGRILASGAERVVFADEADPSLPVALFAAALAGVPFVPVNYRLADDRLRELIARQAPALVVGGPAAARRAAGLEGVRTVLSDDLLAGPDDEPVAPGDRSPDPDAVAVLLHTSGTSGPPKVAVLRHRHLVSYVLGSVELLAAESGEATLVSVPPYHVAGVSALLTAVYGGRRLVQLPAFSPEGWVDAARRQHVTHAMVVPTMLARILDVLDAGHPAPSEPALPALRHLSYGGGRMPRPVIERALARLPGVAFVNAYGLTETSSTVAVLGPDDHRAALASSDPAVRRRLTSVGRPLPTVEITIRGDDGREVPVGQPGEVWVRGEQVSGEYASHDGRSDGWFATRDGGWLDADGYLFVTGRLDDVIVRGGENLSPGEIEDVLLTHDAVAEAAVVGLPDDEWGEVVAAVVVVHPGRTATPGELADFVVRHLRSSRRPAVVEIRRSLPANDTGKILRRVIREELLVGRRSREEVDRASSVAGVTLDPPPRQV